MRYCAREQGPITTGRGSFSKAVDRRFSTTPAAAYGSLRSQGRQRWLGKRPHSRGSISPELFNLVVPLSARAQGKPGANRTRSLGGNKNKPTSKSTTSSASHTGFPAQWFYGLLRALPGERRLLSPLSAGYLPQNRRHGRGARTTRLRRTLLAFSSGEQARLTLAASIASRAQRSVTIAIRPLLVGAG